MGCDEQYKRTQELYQVSIHAPVWGATGQVLKGLVNRRVSIHAPVWGATLLCKSIIIRPLFQSTHPCGVRPNSSGFDAYLVVSIHAPVWGATSFDAIDSSRNLRFNPRTRVGCDQGILALQLLQMFQSTHPCGVRQAARAVKNIGDVSIHAPVWGATAALITPATRCKVSIHAPVWGATTSVYRSTNASAVSIHAPVWGATRALVRIGV